MIFWCLILPDCLCGCSCQLLELDTHHVALTDSAGQGLKQAHHLRLSLKDDEQCWVSIKASFLNVWDYHSFRLMVGMARYFPTVFLVSGYLWWPINTTYPNYCLVLIFTGPLILVMRSVRQRRQCEKHKEASKKTLCSTMAWRQTSCLENDSSMLEYKRP